MRKCWAGRSTSWNQDCQVPTNLNNFSFSYLIAVAKISNTMLKKSGKSGHLCLVTNFSGKAFSFSLSSIILNVGLS